MLAFHEIFGFGNSWTSAVRKLSGKYSKVELAEFSQRPYGIIADPPETPKSIFISGFDSHPLAPDYNFLLRARSNISRRGRYPEKIYAWSNSFKCSYQKGNQPYVFAGTRRRSE